MKSVMYKKRKVTLKVGPYALDNSLEIEMFDTKTGCWTTVTAYIEGYPQPYGYAIITDCTENDGIYKWLTGIGLVEKKISSVILGMTVHPVVKINMEMLEEFDSKGTKKYAEKHKK